MDNWTSYKKLDHCRANSYVTVPVVKVKKPSQFFGLHVFLALSRFSSKVILGTESWFIVVMNPIVANILCPGLDKRFSRMCV